MNYQNIIVETSEAVTTITLNRPDALNSFIPGMLEELLAAFGEAAADGAVRAVLLSGSGRAFCAGQDLNENRDASAGGVNLKNALDNFYNPIIRLISEMEKPVVCAVNGIAAGAGANLALSCDIVLAARSAFFLQAFCRIGLVPDCGGTWALPRLVGLARARALMLLGDKIPAEQAESWGMIWKVVDDDGLIGEARELVSHLAAQPTKGLALIKRAVNAAMTNPLDRQLDLEGEYQGIAGDSKDFREGVNAFFDKRKPRFMGN